MSLLIAKIDVVCPRCSETNGVIRNGHSSSGTQRYRCQQCQKTFQLSYRYNGAKPETHQTIVDMAMNGSGCRDTARVLKISLNTVLRHLNRIRQPWANRQVERMNRNIREASVRRFHRDDHAQLRQHPANFIDAYSSGDRLRTLKGLTPYELICKQWTSGPGRFRMDPIHLVPENIYGH